jgi:hypothetical protein
MMKMNHRIQMYYDPDASENVMNRVFNPRTRKRGHGLRRGARAWRDALALETLALRGLYGLDVRVIIQVISDGKIRGDSQNFVKLTCDAVATGLGLPGDHKFSVTVLPRTRISDIDEPYIEITLSDEEVEPCNVPAVRVTRSKQTTSHAQSSIPQGLSKRNTCATPAILATTSGL